ncbi:MAG TPA: radical SAM protein [Desulfobacterales bacterium]|nr:radical SAM protein [Desulfobacterales bacterium]
MTTEIPCQPSTALPPELERYLYHPVSMLSVHVTDSCNSKCEFCVVNSPVLRVPISTNELVRHVESFAENLPEVLNIHGGEPTISKALFPVLDAAQRIGIPEAHLQTNGIRLANRKYVDRLIEAGVSVFVVSLHGHVARQQEEITLTPNSFAKILRGIRNCLDAGALVRTNTVICKQNIASLYDVLALSGDLGVRWQNISALHPSKHAMSSFQKLVVHPQDVRSTLLTTVKRLREAFPDIVVELEGFPPCHAPGLDALHIDTSMRQIRMIYHDKVFDDYEDYMNDTQRHFPLQCLSCREMTGCSGIYHAYETEFDGPVVWPRLHN